MNETTIDSIIKWFKEQVEAKQPIGPDKWIEGASRLNILREDLDDSICLLEFEIAEKMAEYIEDNKSVAQATAIVKAHPDFLKLNKLKAKSKRIDETIRLAKKRSEINTFNI